MGQLPLVGYLVYLTVSGLDPMAYHLLVAMGYGDAARIAARQQIQSTASPVAEALYKGAKRQRESAILQALIERAEEEDGVHREVSSPAGEDTQVT